MTSPRPVLYPVRWPGLRQVIGYYPCPADPLVDRLVLRVPTALPPVSTLSYDEAMARTLQPKGYRDVALIAGAWHWPGPDGDVTSYGYVAFGRLQDLIKLPGWRAPG